MSAPQVPQQNDASSCGLFMLEFIERLMTDSYYLEDRLNDESGDLDKWFLASDVNGKAGREKIKSVLQTMVNKCRDEGWIEQQEAMFKTQDGTELEIIAID